MRVVGADRRAQRGRDRVARAVADLQQALARRPAAAREAVAAVGVVRELDAEALEPRDRVGRLGREHLDEPRVGRVVRALDDVRGVHRGASSSPSAAWIPPCALAVFDDASPSLVASSTRAPVGRGRARPAARRRRSRSRARRSSARPWRQASGVRPGGRAVAEARRQQAICAKWNGGARPGELSERSDLPIAEWSDRRVADALAPRCAPRGRAATDAGAHPADVSPDAFVAYAAFWHRTARARVRCRRQASRSTGSRRCCSCPSIRARPRAGRRRGDAGARSRRREVVRAMARRMAAAVPVTADPLASSAARRVRSRAWAPGSSTGRRRQAGVRARGALGCSRAGERLEHRDAWACPR